MLRLAFLAAIMWAALGGLAAGAAEREARIALVIGNAAYPQGALANPANDARRMAKALAKVGFAVETSIDADQREMKSQIVDFGERLAAAGPAAVGLFYYAGHGVQANGRNYLIPISADLRREADLDIEAVEADWALLQMREAGNAVNFLILDACRNNPLPRGLRAASRGLARMDAPVGTFVAYATAPGDTAEDGSGDNSPYTTALAEMLTTETAPAEIMFRNVRNRVIELTAGRQVPWDSSSLRGGDFCFSACEPPKAGAPAAQPAPAAPAAPSHELELAYWSSIKDSGDPAQFQAYLADYPDGRFVRLAKLKIDELKKPKPKPVAKPAAPSPAAGGPDKPAGAKPDASAIGVDGSDSALQAITDLVVGAWSGKARSLDLVTGQWKEESRRGEVRRTSPNSVATTNPSSTSTTVLTGRSFVTDMRDAATGFSARWTGSYTRIVGPSAAGDFETEASGVLVSSFGVSMEIREVTKHEGGLMTVDTYMRPVGATAAPLHTERAEMRKVK